MCGITGFYSENVQKVSQEDFERFNHSLSHRGPDFSNVFSSKRAWLGHNRLSIIDLDSRSNQPFSIDHHGRKFHITFNGEIYNYIEIREELQKLGHQFKTDSDTEVVLKSFAEWGADCQKRFNGMWAFAIYSDFNEQLFISRDRFGVKPLYLFIKKTGVWFASEVKAFAHLPKSFQLNCDKEFLSFLSQRPDNKSTLTRNVCALPAGHSVTIKPNLSFELVKWWDTIKNIPDLSNCTEKDLFGEFHNLFHDAIKLRIRSDAKVCSALSGGLDSSAVVSTIAKYFDVSSLEEYKAFIFEYQLSNYSEANYALDICKEYKLRYTLDSHDMDTSLVDQGTIIDCIFSSEQLGNLQLGPYLIYKKMREEGYKVSIDGHGADEILGGYRQFALPSLADALVSGGEGLFHSVANAWTDDQNNYLVDIDSHLNGIQNLIKNNDPNCDGSWMQRKRLNEFHAKTLPWILNTYDKLPMRHGIEVRSPFLDWKLVTFCFGLKNSMLINKGYTKFILREALSDTLPKSVATRKSKLGFLPAKQFFLNLPSIRHLIQETVGSRAFIESSIFDGKEAAKLISQALEKENINELSKLWPLVQITTFSNEWKRKQL